MFGNRGFGLILGVACIATLPGCDGRKAIRADAVDVRLIAEDTTWRAAYVTPDVDGGREEVPTGREVHVPVGADVRLVLTSQTYISDFSFPALGMRDFAAPGLPSEFRFRAAHAGRYDLRGDELCGRPHTDRTRGWIVIEDVASYEAWVRRQQQRSARER